MSIADVRDLPLREKFQILEAIWEDLSSRIEEIPVSTAVRELLDERITTNRIIQPLEAAVFATIYPDMNLNPVIDFRPRF